MTYADQKQRAARFEIRTTKTKTLIYKNQKFIETASYVHLAPVKVCFLKEARFLCTTDHQDGMKRSITIRLFQNV